MYLGNPVKAKVKDLVYRAPVNTKRISIMCTEKNSATATFNLGCDSRKNSSCHPYKF